MRTWISILFVLLLFVAVDKQRANAAPQATAFIATIGGSTCGGLFFNRRNCPPKNVPCPPPKVFPPPIPEFIATPVTSDAVLGGIFFNRPQRICPGPDCPTPNTPGPPPEIEPPPIPIMPPVVSVITNIPEMEPEGMGTAAIIGLLALAGVLGGGIAVARYINQ